MRPIVILLLLVLPCTAQLITPGASNYIDSLEITFDADLWENPTNEARITRLLTGYWPNWTNIWPQYYYGGKPWVMHAAPMIRDRLATNGETPTHYLWGVTLGQIRRTNNTVKAFGDIHDSLPAEDRGKVGVMVSKTTVRTRTTRSTTTRRGGGPSR